MQVMRHSAGTLCTLTGTLCLLLSGALRGRWRMSLGVGCCGLLCVHGGDGGRDAERKFVQESVKVGIC